LPAMEQETVLFEVKDEIAWIRFHRPEKLNAMNSQLLAELEKAVASCEQKEHVRSVVLTGDDKAFIAGADVGPYAKADVNQALQMATFTMNVQDRLADLSKPTIAAISGFALGGGLEIALCCDFRLAAQNAVLGLPEITLGIIPGGGGTQRLPRLIGLGPATEMLLLGGTIKADKALSLGLVSGVYPQGQLLAEAERLAKRLARIPPVALKACKTAIRTGLSAGLKEGLRTELLAFSMLFGTLDQKEGMAAFLEKRKAQFVGK
jgi:enoyl-CoA hydratase/carnithine racemase